MARIEVIWKLLFWRVQKYHPHIACETLVWIPLGIYLTIFFRDSIKMSWRKWDPMENPWLHHLKVLSKMENDSFVATRRSFSKLALSSFENSNQFFMGDMWMIFLYSSERKNNFNYFQITSIRATKILNLLLKKKVTISYLF